MVPATAANQRLMRVSFGGCVFDSDTRQLLRDGEPAALSPKAFTLLQLLIANRPRAVSKDDIRARLWPATHVTEANLSNLVVEIRAALGDDARRSRYIRTLARYGYAFSAPDEVSPTAKDRGVARDRTYRLVWGRREIALEPGENLVGRDRDAVVWIDDESVSRRHARISIADGGAWIEDLDSKNGTFLRGMPVRGAIHLRDRDVVRIGPATLRLRVLRSTGSTRSTMRERAPR